MNCTVKKVIYVTECRGCEKYSIGETNNLRKRTTLHNQHIRHEELRMVPLSGHLASCSDNDPKYFMFPFYKMSSDNILEMKEKEKYFIKTNLSQSLIHVHHKTHLVETPDKQFVHCIYVFLYFL